MGRRYFPGVQAPKTICAEAPSVAMSITLPLTLDIVAFHPRWSVVPCNIQWLALWVDV